MINNKGTSCVRVWVLFVFIFIPSLIHSQKITNNRNTFGEKLSLDKGSVLYDQNGSYLLNEKRKIYTSHQSGDTLFLQFLNDVEKDKNRDSVFTLMASPKEKYFVITNGAPTRLKYRDWDIQPFTVPLKIRPKTSGLPFLFTGDVSVGPYLGYQIGLREYSSLEVFDMALTFALFATPSLIHINPSNNGTNDMTSQSLLGLTGGGGILFDINDYQFGIVSGLDWISGDASTTWVYQGKPWISVSFGFELDKN